MGPIRYGLRPLATRLIRTLTAASAIESITVKKARYLGRSSPLTVEFNPWFNTIIGGRGTGKSTLVDFCRMAVRRDHELDGHDELWRAFQQRLQVPRERGQEGLLTDSTVIQLIYRKDGARFVLSWNRDGSVPSIARYDGDVIAPEDGDIRERFPVRIYSQKQLFDVARRPDALLDVIDDTDAVDGSGLRRRSTELTARYLALRAEARALRAEANDLPARNAALSDVRRKLNVLQTGEHASALKDYRRFRRQEGAWQSIRENVAEGVAAVARTAEDLVVADLDQEVESAQDGADAALRSVHDELAGAVDSFKNAVRRAVASAEQRIRDLGNDPENRWSQAVEASVAEYRAVSKQLETAGISNPAEYRDLLDQQSTLQLQIEHLEQQRTTAQEHEDTAASVLEQYRSIHAALSTRREQFADQVSSELVRVRIDAAGDRSNLAEFLRKTLGIDHFDQDHAALVQRIDMRRKSSWTYRSLDDDSRRAASVRRRNRFVGRTGRKVRTSSETPTAGTDRPVGVVCCGRCRIGELPRSTAARQALEAPRAGVARPTDGCAVGLRPGLWC